jgi:hypothetical protein
MDPSRAALVNELMNREPDWRSAHRRLAEYPWDSQASLEFSNDPLVRAVRDCADGIVGVDELAEWAEAIEMRDDIHFADPRAATVIFELANPELHGGFDQRRARELEALLTD